MGAAFLVPLALTALSSGAQYENSRQASNRENTAEVQALGDQQADRSQANGAVQKLTSQIATDNPSTLSAKATGQYVNTLRSNAAGAAVDPNGASGNSQTFGASTSALPGVVGADSRYKTGTANSQQEVQNFGNTYAGEMGNIDAATRLRQNEGLSMSDLATSLNGINQKSYGQNFVDQLRAQTAGQANPWVTLGANLLGGASNQLSKNPDGYFGKTAGGPNVAADPSAFTGNADTMGSPLWGVPGAPVNARGMFNGAPLPLSVAATDWSN